MIELTRRQVYETIPSCIHDYIFFFVQVVFMILFLMK